MSEAQDIIGLDLNKDACDFLWTKNAYLHKWKAFEVPLFTTKWFDYRFMHPVQATYLFAHHYRRVYKRIFSENFDAERAEYVKGFRGDDLFVQGKSVTISGMWRARQHADAIGCPYDVYISAALNKVLRLNRSNMPYLTELYQGWVLDGVKQSWEEVQRGRLFIAQHPSYRSQSYCGLSAQNEHHEWLFKQAATRDSLPRWLARFIWRDGLLSEDVVAARFGIEMLETAREYS